MKQSSRQLEERGKTVITVQRDFYDDPADNNLVSLIESFKPVFNSVIKTICRTVKNYSINQEKKTELWEAVEFSLYEYYLGRPDFIIDNPYSYIYRMVWNSLFNRKAQKADRVSPNSELIESCEYIEPEFERIESAAYAEEVRAVIDARIWNEVIKSSLTDKPAAYKKISAIVEDAARTGRSYKKKLYLLRAQERAALEAAISQTKDVIYEKTVS